MSCIEINGDTCTKSLRIKLTGCLMGSRRMQPVQTIGLQAIHSFVHSLYRKVGYKTYYKRVTEKPLRVRLSQFPPAVTNPDILDSEQTI